MNSLTENKNLLFNANYRVTCDRIPNFCRFTVDVSLPSISSQAVKGPTPFGADLKLHGDNLDFTDLMFTVALDEDWTSYIDILDWMYSYAAPEKFEQYKENTSQLEKDTHSSKYADITVHALTNKGNANMAFTFYNACPVTLDPPLLNQQLPNRAEPLRFTTSFSYDRVSCKKVT